MNTKVLAVLVAAGISIGMPVLGSAPAQAQQCTVSCSHECWHTPRGLCCARRCVRQCWNPAPHYEPQHREPEPEPHYMAASRSQPPFPPETVLMAILALVGILAAVIFAAAADSTMALRNEIAQAEEDTAAIRTLATDAQRTTANIDAYIDAAAHDSYEAGRAAADEEWTRG